LKSPISNAARADKAMIIVKKYANKERTTAAYSEQNARPTQPAN
jgi:hypothetical protein